MTKASRVMERTFYGIVHGCSRWEFCWYWPTSISVQSRIGRHTMIVPCVGLLWIIQPYHNCIRHICHVFDVMYCKEAREVY
jgi:hypothetical protein